MNFPTNMCVFFQESGKKTIGYTDFEEYLGDMTKMFYDDPSTDSFLSCAMYSYGSSEKYDYQIALFILGKINEEKDETARTTLAETALEGAFARGAFQVSETPQFKLRPNTYLARMIMETFMIRPSSLFGMLTNVLEHFIGDEQPKVGNMLGKYRDQEQPYKTSE